MCGWKGNKDKGKHGAMQGQVWTSQFTAHRPRSRKQGSALTQSA